MDNIERGHIVLKGDVLLESPLIIASGESEKSDIEIIKDKNNKPFIPATSLIGILRHLLNHGVIKEEGIKEFWGYSEKSENGQEKSGSKNNIRQSDIICRDLLLKGNSKTGIRDGIRIDNKTGLAADKSKYDYEILEPGATFDFHIEAEIKKNSLFLKKMFSTIKKMLSDGNVRIGMKTNSGFGRIKLTNTKFYIYDFSKKADVYNYLRRIENPEIQEDSTFSFNKKVFEIEACFKLKTSLIIRSYSSDPKKPDAVHIRSNGKPVLPGTSIKGAIRARAKKIANTILDDASAENLTRTLFGYVDTDNPDAEPIKGKVIVEDQILPDYPEEIQTRIKIDRFTGGTIKGALFDTMPLWSDGSRKRIKIKISIRDYTPAEAGLLILVLKDLWTGDLPLGGEKSIGRGVLEGEKAVIKYGDETLELSQKPESKVIADLTEFIKKIKPEKEAANV